MCCVAQDHKYEGKVQDAYSLRCVPQVHGIVHDTLGFVDGVLTTEMNSVSCDVWPLTDES